jgi:hypothetical protein
MYVHCPSSNAVVEWKQRPHDSAPQDIYIKYRVGQYPSEGEFYILVKG